MTAFVVSINDNSNTVKSFHNDDEVHQLDWIHLSLSFAMSLENEISNNNNNNDHNDNSSNGDNYNNDESESESESESEIEGISDENKNEENQGKNNDENKDDDDSIDEHDNNTTDINNENNNNENKNDESNDDGNDHALLQKESIVSSLFQFTSSLEYQNGNYSNNENISNEFPNNDDHDNKNNCEIVDNKSSSDHVINEKNNNNDYDGENDLSSVSDDGTINDIDNDTKDTLITCPLSLTTLYQDEDDIAATTPSCSSPASISSSWSQSPSDCKRSILKMKRGESIPICTRKRSWKCIPVPDMIAINNSKRVEQSSFSTLLQDTSSISSFDIIERIKGENKEVSFNTVTIREYDLTIGDNPSVSFGTPVTLDWNYHRYSQQEKQEEGKQKIEVSSAETIYDINEYEGRRLGHRKSKYQMYMSYNKRKNVLIHGFGYTEEEVKIAEKSANKAKFLRSITAQVQINPILMPFDRLEVATESLIRKVKRSVAKIEKIKYLWQSARKEKLHQI